MNDDKNTDKVIDKMEELYNKMFTVSGEQIDNIINNTMNSIQIESGEIAEVSQIMDYLKREPGDFVISWGNRQTHFTINGQPITQLNIPANQINFSQLERDNLELHAVMEWERRIVSISIFGLLVHEAYIMFMATLGVGTYVFGQKLEEKNTLKKQQDAQEERWRSKLDEQRYNEWLRGHRKK